MTDIFLSRNIPNKEETEKNDTKPVEKTDKPSFLDRFKTAFTAFSLFPKDIHFENQEDGEQVVLLLRQHWVTNLHWIIISFVLFIAPTIIFPAVSFLKVFSFIPLRFQTVGLIAWYIIIFSYVFISYISWYFNIYIVTNHRVIDVDFYNLLYKEISTAELCKIQDITYKMSGALRIFFDYGYVYIQTAGEQENIEFELIPKPALVVKKITELIEGDQK